MPTNPATGSRLDRLLKALVANPNTLISGEALARIAWPTETSDFVRVEVSRAVADLRGLGWSITTLRGRRGGYAYTPQGKLPHQQAGILPGTRAEKVLRVLKENPNRRLRAIEIFAQTTSPSAFERHKNPYAAMHAAIAKIRESGITVEASRGGFMLVQAP
jgi:biotin operon repressor